MGAELLIERAVSYASAEEGAKSALVDKDSGTAACSIDRSWGSGVEDFVRESVVETSKLKISESVFPAVLSTAFELAKLGGTGAAGAGVAGPTLEVTI
jgi:hypothetical protein